MAAAATDKVRKKKSNFSTTLSSGINNSTSTVPLSSSSGLPSDTGVTLTIDRVDANAVSTPGKMERVTGIVGVNQLTSATRGVEGSAQAHDSGAIVEDIWEAATWNDMCTAFLVNHSQAGHLKAGAEIDDTSGDHQYLLQVSELAADRNITLPLLLSADSFVFADHIQTLQNKTLITPTINSFATMQVIQSADTPSAPSAGYVIIYAKSDGKIYRRANGGSETEVGSTGVDFLERQSVMNGCFDIWQRATTFTPGSDDSPIVDRWIALIEGSSSWTFSRSTDVPTGGIAKYALKAECQSANNQCGIVQIIEGKDTAKLAGKTVSLSFYAKTENTEIANLRATVLAWSSTEDSVTSDVVGTWASDGTDPTFATNWTKEIAGSNKALTNSYQRFTIENISLDTSSTTNLAVFVWVDDGTIASGDAFYITGVQVNEGTTALPLTHKTFSQELRDCQRFYQKSFEYAVTPAQATADYLGAEFALQINTNAAGSVRAKFNGRMRTTPTITTYSPGNADTHWYDIDNGQTRTAVVDNVSESGFTIRSTAFSGTNTRNYIHWSAEAEL